MKLLYVHGNSDTIGGIEILLANSLKYHRLIEPHLIFINYGRLVRQIQGQGFTNLEVFNGGRLRYLPRTLLCISRIVKYIKKHNIDLVLGNGQHAWIYAGLAARISNVPGIYYEHGILTEREIQLPNWIGFLASSIKPYLVFANSKIVQDTVRKYLNYEAHLLYPGVTFDASFCPQEKCLRSEFSIPASSMIVTMIGRIQEWKGQEYLLKAIPSVLHEFPDTYFLIVGSPTFKKDTSYYKKLMELRASFSFQEKVIFAGFREDVVSILKQSDILVHASITPEPFGLVVLEGMSSGCPVIATNAGGPTEIIKHRYDGLLVPPKDEFAIADAILELIRNSSLKHQLSQNALKTIEERFSMNRYVLEMEQILSEKRKAEFF